MDILIGGLFVWLVSTIMGTMMLIQLGGWLPILVAVLNLLFFFSVNGIFIMSLLMNAMKKEEK